MWLNSGNGELSGSYGSTDFEGFEVFLAEAAIRGFYSESHLPTAVLLDKVKERAIQKIEKGPLQDLHAFIKEGLKAHRLPFPKGEKKTDGTEKITLEDCKYDWDLAKIQGFKTTPEENVKQFDSYSLVTCIIDDLICKNFG